MLLSLHGPLELAIVHTQSHRRQDPLTAFANGRGQGDERLHAAALGF